MCSLISLEENCKTDFWYFASFLWNRISNFFVLVVAVVAHGRWWQSVMPGRPRPLLTTKPWWRRRCWGRRLVLDAHMPDREDTRSTRPCVSNMGILHPENSSPSCNVKNNNNETITANSNTSTTTTCYYYSSSWWRGQQSTTMMTTKHNHGDNKVIQPNHRYVWCGS